jgi:hypothetical protein
MKENVKLDDLRKQIEIRIRRETMKTHSAVFVR